MAAVDARAINGREPGGRIVERRSQTRAAKVHRAVRVRARVRADRLAIVDMALTAVRAHGGVGVEIVGDTALVGVGVRPGDAGQVRETGARVADVTILAGTPATLGIQVAVAGFAVVPCRKIAAAVFRIRRAGTHQLAQRAGSRGRIGAAVTLGIVAGAIAVRAVEIERARGHGDMVLLEARRGVDDGLGCRGGDGGWLEIAAPLRLRRNHEDVGGRAGTLGVFVMAVLTAARRAFVTDVGLVRGQGVAGNADTPLRVSRRRAGVRAVDVFGEVEIGLVVVAVAGDRPLLVVLLARPGKVGRRDVQRDVTVGAGHRQIHQNTAVFVFAQRLAVAVLGVVVVAVAGQVARRAVGAVAEGAREETGIGGAMSLVTARALIGQGIRRAVLAGVAREQQRAVGFSQRVCGIATVEVGDEADVL